MRRAACVCVLILCCSPFARAQAPVRAMVAAAYSPQLKVGDKVVGTWNTMECLIERSQGDWAWIHTEDGKEGWVRSNEVVPLDKAVDYFTQKIAAEPGNLGWRQTRAVAYQRQGKLDQAIADISEAIKLAPADLEHYYNARGNFYLQKKDYDRALADYNQSLRLRPDNAYAWNNAGVTRRAKGDYDKAIENLTRAISIDPAYPNAYESRAHAWADKHDYDRALADYAKAIQLDPKLLDAYFGRAALWETKGEFGKALADLQKCTQIDPDEADAHNGLAWLLATCPDDDTRDGPRAVAEAQKACELSAWEDLNAIDTLAAAYAEAGNFDKAVEYAQRAVEQAPEAKQAAYQKRLKLYRQKKPFRRTAESGDENE
ncbi:MAG TPA: tetratricopeptide repeat protein [Pirellulales bacterium]|nr:tetratricopeptide repeat protein [Pirellulales bacterium]